MAAMMNNDSTAGERVRAVARFVADSRRLRDGV
jgi:hypothetical protein